MSEAKAKPHVPAKATKRKAGQVADARDLTSFRTTRGDASAELIALFKVFEDLMRQASQHVSQPMNCRVHVVDCALFNVQEPLSLNKYPKHGRSPSLLTRDTVVHSIGGVYRFSLFNSRTRTYYQFGDEFAGSVRDTDHLCMIATGRYLGLQKYKIPGVVDALLKIFYVVKNLDTAS